MVPSKRARGSGGLSMSLGKIGGVRILLPSCQKGSFHVGAYRICSTEMFVCIMQQVTAARGRVWCSDCASPRIQRTPRSLPPLWLARLFAGGLL